MGDSKQREKKRKKQMKRLGWKNGKNIL